MSFFLQILWMMLMVLGIVVALWVGIWLLIAFFAIGVTLVVWSHLRGYLLAKGILNPRPGVPMDGIIIEEEASTSTLIEGDFTRVDEEKTPKP